MLYRELVRWGRILGENDPYVNVGLKAAMHHPELIPSISNHFMVALVKRGYDLANLPAFPLPPSLPTEGIRFADVLDGERISVPLRLPLSAFSVSTLVCGASGAGKTMAVACGMLPHLINEGIKVIVFDPEDQYHLILCSLFPPEKVIAFKMEEFRINPIAPPGNMSAEEWKRKFAFLCRGPLYMGDGMENLLIDVLSFVYANHSSPTIFHVKARLDSLHYKPSERHYGYHEALLNRFNRVIDAFGKTFDCAEGFLKKEILGKVDHLQDEGP